MLVVSNVADIHGQDRRGIFSECSGIQILLTSFEQSLHMWVRLSIAKELKSMLLRQESGFGHGHTPEIFILPHFI